MRPRILLRTHYEADEPRLIIAAATRCSSPTESRGEDFIASALKKWAHENGYVLSLPGAIYAVGNARHLELLNKSNRWTASGMMFAFLDQLVAPVNGPRGKRLMPAEERAYLRLYLLGAGAFVIKFGRWLLESGATTDDRIRDDSIIEEQLVSVLSDYLKITVEARDRAMIRQEKERLSRAKYASITKRHKRYPLLTTMNRLRLINVTEDNGKTVIRPDQEGRLAAIVRALPDVESLERTIRFNKLQEVLDIELREYARNDLPSFNDPHVLILQAYAYCMSLGHQACSLQFLDVVLSSLFPASPTSASPVAESLLEPAHKQYPGEVRFHVDRKGHRAFVLLSKNAEKCLRQT